MSVERPTSGPVIAFFRAVLRSSQGAPFATNLSLIAIPIGAAAIIAGPKVSRAFTEIINRPEPIYVWGVVLLLGGSNVALGIGRHRPSLEMAGLFFLAFGFGIYGISVIAGLGVGGLVAGPTTLALAMSCLQRAHLISLTARSLARVRAAAAAVASEFPPMDETPKP